MAIDQHYIRFSWPCQLGGCQAEMLGWRLNRAHPFGRRNKLNKIDGYLLLRYIQESYARNRHFEINQKPYMWKGYKYNTFPLRWSVGYLKYSAHGKNPVTIELHCHCHRLCQCIPFYALYKRTYIWPLVGWAPLQNFYLNFDLIEKCVFCVSFHASLWVQ